MNNRCRGKCGSKVLKALSVVVTEENIENPVLGLVIWQRAWKFQNMNTGFVSEFYCLFDLFSILAMSLNVNYKI